MKPINLNLDKAGLLKCKKLRRGAKKAGEEDVNNANEFDVGVTADMVVHSSPLTGDNVYEDKEDKQIES